jgi:hypothetical protein
VSRVLAHCFCFFTKKYVGIHRPEFHGPRDFTDAPNRCKGSYMYRRERDLRCCIWPPSRWWRRELRVRSRPSANRIGGWMAGGFEWKCTACTTLIQHSSLHDALKGLQDRTFGAFPCHIHSFFDGQLNHLLQRQVFFVIEHTGIPEATKKSHLG